MAINFSVKTQAVAYQTGYQDALSELVDALLERGSASDLIDVLEMKINRPEVSSKLRAHYEGK